MKRYLSIILLLLLCFQGSIIAQTTKEIHLQFSEKDFYMESRNNELFIRTEKYKMGFVTRPYDPALPYVIIQVLVEPNYEMLGFTFNRKEVLIKEGVNIAPIPEEIPTNASWHHNESKTDYIPRIYPDSMVIYNGSHLMDGYRFLSFAVCPFRYNSATKELYMVQELNIHLNSKLSFEDSRLNGKTENQGLFARDMIRETVINSDDLDILYGNVKQNSHFIKSKNEKTSGEDYDYEYLIITSESLKSSFQQLANWKTQKGIRTKVLTVEHIDDTYTGSRQQLRIKKAIKDYKENSTCPLKYVLLGGDTGIVPAQEARVRLYTRDPYFHYFWVLNETDTPADIFYSCLDSLDWDTNGNGIYGEYGGNNDQNDNVDKIPDVSLTRVPVNTSTEADNYIRRLIDYENPSDTTNWNSQLLLAGKHLSSKPYYNVNGVTMSDTQYKSEWMYTDDIMNYWTGVKKRFYDTDTDFGGSSYDFNVTNLQAQLNNGYAFVNIRTHGDTTLIKMEGSDFTVSDAMNIENTGHTIIVTEACLTNAFDQPTSLSEAFMRNPDSGILGYYGCSREGWYSDTISSRGTSNELNGEFYRQLFTDKQKHYGEIAWKAKHKVLWLFDSSKFFPHGWLQYGVNPLGDPEMPIFIETPRIFENASCFSRNDSLIVSPGVDSCRICVMSLQDNGASHYEVYNNASSVPFVIPTVDCSICITRPGYVPYIVDYYDAVYVQNKTITGQEDIFAKRVFIGSDVTTEEPQGAVNIVSGQTRVIGNEITVEKDFTVTQGATLYMGNQ